MNMNDFNNLKNFQRANDIIFYGSVTNLQFCIYLLHKLGSSKVLHGIHPVVWVRPM